MNIEFPSGGSNDVTEITKEAVLQVVNTRSKRICFSKDHKQEPKKTGPKESNKNFYGTINVPFYEGFKNIFPLRLFENTNIPSNPFAHWAYFDSEEKYREIYCWARKQGDRVFLRNCLYTSMALSYFADQRQSIKTKIGDLVHSAKYDRDQSAINKLIEYCNEVINDESLHGETYEYPYRNANLICAVPPRREKEFDLPTRIASELSVLTNKPDITKKFIVDKLKIEEGEAKSIPLDAKWEAWEEAQVTFSPDYDLRGKSVILIDDLYQSGISMQYAAMELQQAGAGKICELCVAKTMRDADNQ